MEHQIITQAKKLLSENGLFLTTASGFDVYTTLALYPNGEFKINGVKQHNIVNHVAYNLLFRPGRALFVQGKCIYKGFNNSNESINEVEQMFIQKKIAFCDKDTAPYI